MTERSFHVTLVLVAMLWLFADPASAMLHPQQGRFMQRDPLGYVDGMSGYEYVRSSPLQTRDLWGLWGDDVHNGRTKQWSVDAGIPEEAADVIGSADAAVDNGFPFLGEYLGMALTSTGPLPVAGDQGWHFNANKSRPGTFDTRFVYGQTLYSGAKEICSLEGGANLSNAGELAAKALGSALHPWQDWWAHGDYGYSLPGDLWSTHNAHSPQTAFGDPSGYPDDPELDALGSMNGRVTIGLLRRTRDGHEYAVYVTGSRRIEGTQRMTTGTFKDFLSYLRRPDVNPVCKCYFGVSP